MVAKVTKAILAFSLMVATLSAGGSDSFQNILGTYKLVGVNDSELPAVTWVGPGEGCKQETLSGTLLVGSESRWTALIEAREDCSNNLEEESTGMVRSTIFTGTYTVSGNMIEFHDGELGGTDHASLENDVLRYTVNDYEGQTAVLVFVRNK